MVFFSELLIQNDTWLFLLEHWEEITDELKEDFTLELDFRPLISLLGALFDYFWPSSSPLPVFSGSLWPSADFFDSRNPQRWFFVSFRDKANVKYEWNFLICKYYLFYIFILLLTYSEHKRRTFWNCQVRFIYQVTHRKWWPEVNSEWPEVDSEWPEVSYWRI